MKTQELKQWREKSAAEIGAQIDELSTKLSGAYLAKAARKLDNVAMVKNLRRDIAQLKTLQTEQAAKVEKAETI